jgi:hypothetical protein
MSISKACVMLSPSSRRVLCRPSCQPPRARVYTAVSPEGTIKQIPVASSGIRAGASNDLLSVPTRMESDRPIPCTPEGERKNAQASDSRPSQRKMGRSGAETATTPSCKNWKVLSELRPGFSSTVTSRATRPQWTQSTWRIQYIPMMGFFAYQCRLVLAC